MDNKTSSSFCQPRWACLVMICLLTILAITTSPTSGHCAMAVSNNAGQANDSNIKFAVDEDQEDLEVTELWTGKVYSSTFRFGICFSSRGKVRGVLHLRQRNGQVDTYHFTGTSSRQMVQATHASGHSFTGELIGSDRMEGSIQLKNGLNINLEGRRQQNVRLDMSDCSPLPE